MGNTIKLGKGSDGKLHYYETFLIDIGNCTFTNTGRGTSSVTVPQAANKVITFTLTSPGYTFNTTKPIEIPGIGFTLTWVNQWTAFSVTFAPFTGTSETSRFTLYITNGSTELSWDPQMVVDNGP